MTQEPMDTRLMQQLADRLSMNIMTGHDWPNSDDELLRLQSARMMLRAAEEIERLLTELSAFREAAKEAPGILDLMIRCSKTACPPMHHLLTTDGLYSFHMANLWVRTNGQEYTMEADWADNCGKLVKRLTELVAPNPRRP